METVSGAELLVRTLKHQGVTHAFHITGLGLIPVAEAFYRHRESIRYISALNETNLSLIAQGYARAAHQPAFVNLYHASGTSLAMMGVTTAWAEQVPVIFTSTVSSTTYADTDQYAAVPRAITEMTEQFTKWSAEVPSPTRIAEYLERAFQIAMTPPYGPVHLAFPMDFWIAQVPDIGGTSQNTKVATRTVEVKATEDIAAMLEQAQRPLIVAGGEVERYGATSALVALAEQTGVPVAVEPKISDLGFPTSHPQYVGKFSAIEHDLDTIDLVFLIGVEFTESGLTPAIRMPKSARVILLSSDPLALTRQVKADLTVLSHPQPALELIGQKLNEVSAASQQKRSLSIVKNRREALNRLRAHRKERTTNLRKALSEARGEGALSILDVTEAIDAVRDQHTIVVNHSASGEPPLEDLLEYPDTSGYFGISAKASAQGWGGPASIGIKLANPHRKVITVLGDGGFMFSSTAIHTAARYQIPVVYIILNNGGWRDIAALSRATGGDVGHAEDAMGWTFDIDHALFAESLGLRSARVSQKEELFAELRKALQTDFPTLIEVINSPADADVFAQTFLGKDKG